MSDETIRTGAGRAGEPPAVRLEGTAAGPQAKPADARAGNPVRFCQDCGRALTAETVRVVGSGVFCEPCLEARISQAQRPFESTTAWSAAERYTAGAGNSGPGPYTGFAGAAAVPDGGTVPPNPAVPDAPNPLLAALLGLIPGVGAMYNGQFAKGFAHLAIFTVLTWLSDSVNGIFGLLVAGWVFYQSVEAYHTAVARRNHLPLPNTFGLNDIGERLGFAGNWGAPGRPAANGSGTPPYRAPGTNSYGTQGWTEASGQPADPVTSPSSAPYGGAAAPPTTPPPPYGAATASPWQAEPPTSGAAAPLVEPGPPATAGPAWVGYVAPNAFAQSGFRQPSASRPQSPVSPHTGSVSYAASASHAGYPPQPPSAASGPGGSAGGTTAGFREASGFAETYTGGVAAAYSGMPGVSTPLPPSSLPQRFPAAAIWLISLGILVFLANLLPNFRISDRWLTPLLFAGLSVWVFTRRRQSGQPLVCILRWPLLLMVIAFLFALHAAYFVVTFGIMAAVLLIALGAILVAERTLGVRSGPQAFAGGNWTSTASAATPPPSASWGATSTAATSPTHTQPKEDGPSSPYASPAETTPGEPRSDEGRP